MFIIRYAESVVDDLAVVRAFERRQLLDQIDRQLSREPTRETRNKKILRGLRRLGNIWNEFGNSGSTSTACSTTWMWRQGKSSFGPCDASGPTRR